jgi:exodeoxyribonuclease VII small subunit
MSESLPETRTFEQSLADLEQLVRELEDGKLGLDEALIRYERGVGLIKQCHEQLSTAERRILQLTGLTSEGQPVLQPFGHEATAPAPKGRPIDQVGRRVRKKAEDRTLYDEP